MNFKLTLWKSIVSVLVFIILDLIAGTDINCDYIGCRWNSIQVIVISIIVGLFVYLIWSLFEKKK